MRRASLVEPITHFVFFLSLFTLPLPVRLVFTRTVAGDISPQLGDFAAFVPISVAMTALALVVFYFAYESRLGEKLAGWVPLLQTTSARRTGVAGAAIVGVALILLSILAGGPENLGRFLLLGYGATAETFGSGYLAVGLPWLSVAVMFFWVAYAVSKHWAWFVVGALALVADLGVQFVLGSRSMMLYMVLAFGIFFTLKVRRLRWKSIAVICLLGFLSLNVIGMTRTSEYKSFGQFISTTAQTGVRELSHSTEGLFYTLTVGEFVVPFETLPQMVRKVGSEIAPWWGLSYVRAPLFLIPSAIYHDRPPGLSYWYMHHFYGQVGHQNEGRGFFFLAEAYLNFGPFGIVLIAGIWGVAWRALYAWAKRSDFDAGATMIYALVLAYMFRMIAGDAVTIVAGVTQQSLVIAIAGLLFSGARIVSQGRVGVAATNT